MKVLLYYAGDESSFRLYTDPNSVVINTDKMSIDIQTDEGIDTWDHVRSQSILMADRTKNCPDIIVKIVVDRPATECPKCNSKKTSLACETCNTKSWVKN